MKSFFSCIPRKRVKSKKCTNLISEENLINNNKSIDANNHNVESHIEKHDVCHVEQINHTDKNVEIINETIDEQEEISKQLKENEERDLEKKRNEALENALYIRLNNALLRIENVSNVLNNKYVGYYLPKVIDHFDSLCLKELHSYLIESESLDLSFKDQSQFIKQLFYFQRSILVMVKEQMFDDVQNTIDDFRQVVIKINEFCIEDDNIRELNRLIADSIVIFGWICVLDRPGMFLQNNLDGYFINITRLLNDGRFARYSNWIKSWAVVLKRFSFIVTQNFQAALMWGLDGPVPMDMLKCLIECNYSRLDDNSAKMSTKLKEKVIKTTAVDHISCETMTNLMDDLRSGRQKTRLKPIKLEEAPLVSESRTPILENGIEEKFIPDLIENEEKEKIVSYYADRNLWIIENVHDEADIEVPNKELGNSVLIRNCHNCSIQIDGVLGSIKIDRSSMVNLVMDDVTGTFEVLDSSNIESQLFCKIRKVDLKNVTQFKLFIPLTCVKDVELISSKSSDIELYVSKTDDGGLELTDYNQFSLETRCRSKLSGSELCSELF